LSWFCCLRQPIQGCERYRPHAARQFVFYGPLALISVTECGPAECQKILYFMCFSSRT
jgi:hypothetical protein